MATYKESLLDKLSNALSPVMRKLHDINIILMGTKADVLRIVKTTKDSWGDQDASLETNVIHNAMIKFPFSNIEMFADKTDQSSIDINAIDIMDLLPIEMTLQFEGDYSIDPIAVIKGDIIVHVHYDENGNKIPLIMEVERLRGSFFGKNLISKKCELSLTRGAMEADIDAEIQNYINSL